MLLRPRHVSAPVPIIEEDGNKKKALLPPMATIAEDGLGVLPMPPTEKDRRKRIFRRSNLKLKLHLGGFTRTRRRAVLAACGGWCLLSIGGAFLFIWFRAVAMARVASSASSSAAVDRQGGMFTIVVNTFERPRQMEEAVRHYAKCPSVESVRVAWSEPSPPPDATTSPLLFDHPRPVKIHAYPTTSINNRFMPPSDLMTEAVFVVDDDIAVPCEHLLSAFNTWQQHPDTLVGFFPRSHSYQPPTAAGVKEDGGNGNWEYLYFWRVLWSMEYSIILTKAAFVHAKYLELYSSGGGEGGGGGDVTETQERRRDDSAGSAWSEATVRAMVKTRAYVDSHRNCEDIAMQMAVTSVSGLPPVAAFAPVVDVGLFGGISIGEGSGKWWQAPHAKKRSRCLADLREIFCDVADEPLLPPPPFPDNKEQGATDRRRPRTRRCEPLIRTDLFASTPRATATPSIRGGVRGRGGDGDGNSSRSDLSRLSRWGLAVRAPTLAEFVSADMLLVPAKLWKWFAKDDIRGRR
ncbi:Glycosyltransferase, family GT64 [Ectocarpus siliculosus]|uniref:Glycosyltransferase, family GT64 n=1 Tax=Ectocarpus siliculosus TaxID=2880 RepID=D8LSZ5_ECTSI|nr:Glycosyltransferase, family GT64 [Ectocarpus siliculosus]|eukprot:CBN77922.1 Glycosyltransferase, family GT64 [Ectocarpus siliculosus]